MSKNNVTLKAVLAPDGHIVCHLACNSQSLKITFTGKDILLAIREQDAVPGSAGLEEST